MDEFDSYEVEEVGHCISQIYSHQPLSASACYMGLMDRVRQVEEHCIHQGGEETLPDAPCCSLYIHDVMSMSWI